MYWCNLILGKKMSKKKTQTRKLKKLMTLEKYVESFGCQVINVTNAYELIRFIPNSGSVCVVYNGKKGINFNNGMAKDIYAKWNGGKIKPEKSKFKSVKRKIRKLLKDVSCKKEDVIKYVCEEMGYNTLNFTEINDIESLRDIWRLIKQYENLFT